MRPTNFPTIRIAEFAQLIYSSQSLTSKVLEINSLQNIEQLFAIQLHEYWDYHFKFEDVSIFKQKHFGKQSIEILAINTIVPFLFAYGVSHANSDIKQRALILLEEIPSENNAIISQWRLNGIQSHSAFRGQALLQLNNEYCKNGKCLQCLIGHKILSKKCG